MKNTVSKWIEERQNEWTYQLRCPKCGYVYSPNGYEDGTTEYLVKHLTALNDLKEMIIMHKVNPEDKKTIIIKRK